MCIRDSHQACAKVSASLLLHHDRLDRQAAAGLVDRDLAVAILRDRHAAVRELFGPRWPNS
eukprot:1791422-Alexandrium_andersonii.AAC.1